MSLIKIDHLNKHYKVSSSSVYPVLRDINLEFPETGLISILGKSGCGKSTLINLLALLDKPTSGNIYVDNKDISKYKRKRIEQYRKREIGIVFQHYNLLEDQDVIYNVALPLLIDGYSYSYSKDKALTLLKGINMNDSLFNKKVNKLSGGEKQRIAILRAIISSPKILLCDEPTGALDSQNAALVMDLVKKISEERLVIMVSHNQKLIEKYSDRIIYLDEGKVNSDIIINQIDKPSSCSIKDKHIHHDGWVDKIALSNFKRRWGRNLISLLSLSICLLASTLVVGFIQNVDKRINEECEKHLDIGVSSVSKETSSSIDNTLITLVRSSRPSKEEVTALVDTNRYYIENNYEALVPKNSLVSYNENTVKDIFYSPIYSFVDESINHSLLLQGHFPKEDSLLEVVINKKAYELLKKSNSTPLNSWIDVSYQHEVNYYTYDSDNTIINDIFVYQKRMKIVGVVDELDFLSNPTIYYPYVALSEYLSNYLLNNYSEYVGFDYSWKDKIDDCNNTDRLTSYSYTLFAKKYSYYSYISNDNSSLNHGLVISNNALVIQEALSDLISASCIGVEIFLVIALVGSVLILGLISYSSYSEDKKRSAILSCLGTNLYQIMNVYVSENVMVALFSIIISFLLLIPIKNTANFLLFKFTGISNMIELPSYLLPQIHLSYSYYLFVIIAVFIIVIISTCLPIVLSKKISIIEELKEE